MNGDGDGDGAGTRTEVEAIERTLEGYRSKQKKLEAPGETKLEDKNSTAK